MALSRFASTPAKQPATNNSCSTASDVEVPDGPKDSISSLAFSPLSNHLAVASWDNSVRIYEIGQTVAGRSMYQHEAPVLDVCWSHDGTKIMSGGVDNAARMLDVQTDTPTQVAAHQAPIKGVRWTDMHGGLLITGSWDKTLKYWDLRQPTPVASLDLVERCYAMDLQKHLLVIATAEGHFQLVDLRNPGAFSGPTLDSTLKFQTRSLAVAPDASNYAVGGIEGRVSMTFTPEIAGKSANYSFRCHRAPEPLGTKKNAEQAQIFTVNSLAYHPIEGTCASAGSDGILTIWDVNNKRLLKNHDLKNSDGRTNQMMPITATAFNHLDGGNILAYAVSYDWSHGYRGNVQGHPNKVVLHALAGDEIKKRAK